MKTDLESNDLVLIELYTDDREEMFERWFAERRTSSMPPPRQSVPPIPMGDDDVDRWLR